MPIYVDFTGVYVTVRPLSIRTVGYTSVVASVMVIHSRQWSN